MALLHVHISIFTYRVLTLKGFLKPPREIETEIRQLRFLLLSITTTYLPTNPAHASKFGTAMHK